MSPAANPPSKLSLLLAGVTPYHWLAFAGCWLGGIFDGMDSTLMAVVMPAAITDLTGQASQVAQVGGWVHTVFLLGWTLGGVLFGWVGDRFGRLPAMIGAILVYSLCTGLSGLAPNWEMLAVFRFLTGLGIGGELVSIATFLSEVWPERSRALAIGALLTSYQAGVFLAGLVHFVIPHWRVVFWVGALPALLVIVLRLTLKESDRWLAHQEEPAAAATSFSTTSPWRNPKLRHQLLIGALAFTGLLVGYWASLSWIPAWLQTLLGGQPEALVARARSAATMFQGVGAVLGCLCAGPVSNALGRRPTLILGALGSFFASWWLFGGTLQYGQGVYAVCMVLGFWIGLMQAGMYIYLPELFPTKIRATATGFCLNAGRLVTAAAVATMGWMVAALGGYANAALAFASLYLLAAFAVLWGPETRGHGLQDA
jgi:MFS family permease